MKNIIGLRTIHFLYPFLRIFGPKMREGSGSEAALNASVSAREMTFPLRD